MIHGDAEFKSDSAIPLDDASGGLERIVGTRMFRDVLYSEAHVDRATPDGFFPGERISEIEWNVKTARRIGIDEPDRVVVPRGQLTLSGSYPFTTVVYFDQMIVRGRLLRHRRGPPLFEHNGYALEQLYRAAVDSDQYAVELIEADYETGSVTITVEKTA
jgi:hypothetical protein